MPKSSRQDKFYETNQERFQAAFTADQEWFMQWGDVYEPRSGELLVHQDNGKKILIVVHTDYVIPTIPSADQDNAWISRYGCHQPLPNISNFGPYTFTNTGRWFPQDNAPVAPKTLSKTEEYELSDEWVSQKAAKLGGPVVDDRLGCALALGCQSWADILFTDCEEQGRSTAAFFQAPRAYNWIIGLDRRGTDVVTYDYDDKDWLDVLGDYFTVGHGSFSDIGYLEKLGTACVNMGVGYYNEHTTSAYWNPKETEEQFNKLYAFWSAHRDTQFNHIPPKATSSTTLGRHEGKDQYSLHGREWLLDEVRKPAPLSSTVIVPYIAPYKTWKAETKVASKSSRSATPGSTQRYLATPIANTVWDEWAADYRPVSDLDWDSPDTQEFIDQFYPSLVPELLAWKASLHLDTPNDPLMREYGYSF